jgi:Rieske 2Fe-2S family protein
VCPYHAWTYNLDGTLRAAPYVRFDAGCPKEQFSLVPVQLDTWGGFVFVNLAEKPATPLREQLDGPVRRLVRYPLDDLPSRRADRVRREGELEDHHGELQRVLSLRTGAPGALRARAGLSRARGRGSRLGRRHTASTRRLDVTMSGTSTRAPFPGLSDTEKTHHKGEVAYPNLLLSVAAEHVAAFVLWPMAPDHTRIACDLLFHVSETGKPDFDRATWSTSGTS